MIKIKRSTHRTFVFPSRPAEAFDFYENLNRTFSFLPYISIFRQYSDTAFRMLYQTTELGIYQVRIFCDLQAEFDREQAVLRFKPSDGMTPVPESVGKYSLSGQGFYQSESKFKENGSSTNIDFKLEIQANLPVPPGLKYFPNRTINRIANGITNWRMEEIADSFTIKSLQAYHEYLEFHLKPD